MITTVFLAEDRVVLRDDLRFVMESGRGIRVADEEARGAICQVLPTAAKAQNRYIVQTAFHD